MKSVIFSLLLSIWHAKAISTPIRHWRGRMRKFTRRFTAIEDRAKAEAIDIDKAGLDRMEHWWTEIKQSEKSG